MGRLGLGGSRVGGWLGSGVWVSASFQIFALTAGECPKWEGKLSGRGNVRVEYVRGRTVQDEMSCTLRTFLPATTESILLEIEGDTTAAR